VDQLNTAAQMRFALDVAKRLNAKSKIVLVDGLERIDDEQRAAFVAHAIEGGLPALRDAGHWRPAPGEPDRGRVVSTTREMLAAGLETLLAAANKKGAQAERARVARIRDACFAGLVLDDPTVREAIQRFDGMLLRGEDVAS
jgi:hypothetical protein